MNNRSASLAALAGTALLALSQPAAAISCSDDGGNNFTVNPATACVANPQAVPDNDSYPSGNPYPDTLVFQPGGFQFNWTGIDKDPGEVGNPESALVYGGTNLGGTFTVNTTGLTYLHYSLFLKGGSDGAFFLLDMSQAVNGVLSGNWSITSLTTAPANGLSHISLYGTGVRPPDRVPEPGTLALLALSLAGMCLRGGRK